MSDRQPDSNHADSQALHEDELFVVRTPFTSHSFRIVSLLLTYLDYIDPWVRLYIILIFHFVSLFHFPHFSILVSHFLLLYFSLARSIIYSNSKPTRR